MKQYIDKDKVVEEIENLISALKEHCNPNPFGNTEECMAAAEIGALNTVLDTINTLEVKEVDLEKSLKGFMGRYAYENGGEYPSAIDIAKHYFELGLKARKGE